MRDFWAEIMMGLERVYVPSYCTVGVTAVLLPMSCVTSLNAICGVWFG